MNSDPGWLPLARPLVQFFETCVRFAYPDPASPLAGSLQARGLWSKTLQGAPIPMALSGLSGAPWTCGWGTTGPDVVQGTVWTQDTCDARLDAGLLTSSGLVDQAVLVTVSPQIKAALVSIVNNVGPGRAAAGKDPGRDGIIVLANGRPSTLLRNINALQFASAADQFLAWNRGGGQVLAGLVKRRAAERSLFLTGTWSK